MGDVATIVGGGMHTEPRRAHEAALIKEYHRALTEDHGVTGYSFERCWDDYEFQLVKPFLQLIFTAPSFLKQARARHARACTPCMHAHVHPADPPPPSSSSASGARASSRPSPTRAPSSWPPCTGGSTCASPRRAPCPQTPVCALSVCTRAPPRDLHAACVPQARISTALIDHKWKERVEAMAFTSAYCCRPIS